MSNYNELQKIIKKGKKISNPVDLLDSLIKEISLCAENKEKNLRDFDFLTLYYGLQGKSLTLEGIGNVQENKLTRERVRQIINNAYSILSKNNNDNSYIKASNIFKEILNNNAFIRADDLLSHEYFNGFKKNIKGLIAFLNDCNIKQIAYRKKFYFYLSHLKRADVVSKIQIANKSLRKQSTEEKALNKSKTVTYVPNEVRDYLLKFSEKNDINLNPLYESILHKFINESPYKSNDFVFEKTKSWKARKGKAQWQQIGIYIDKTTFNLVRNTVKSIKLNHIKNVSLMSFICQSFVWFYDINKNN